MSANSRSVPQRQPTETTGHNKRFPVHHQRVEGDSARERIGLPGCALFRQPGNRLDTQLALNSAARYMLTMTMRRVRVFVSGKVQRVRYRESTREEASRLGLSGWVRNVDERVEFVAQGDSQHVDALLAWARRGPPAAKVTGLEVIEEPDGGAETGFRVV